MNKVLLSILFSAFILTGASYAQTPPPAPATTTTADSTVTPPAQEKKPHRGGHDRHTEIHRAMHKLRDAKEDLQKAAHDYGGHKAKALAAIDEALSELHEALIYDSK